MTGTKISEAVKIIGEDNETLLYWVFEFHQLNPDRDNEGYNVFTERDMELLRKIKQYHVVEKLPISEVRKRLSAEAREAKKNPNQQELF